jgi:transposase
MKAPICIRPPSSDERRQIKAGLDSWDALVVRRCQILLASERGERAPAIARQLGCTGQTVRNVINGFNTRGLAVLSAGSSRPHRLGTVFSQDSAQRLGELLHRPPRDFGREQSFWTLQAAAQVSCEHGLIAAPTSVESVRRALQRLGTNWTRAKHWISSPDPQYQRKKTAETA